MSDFDEGEVGGNESKSDQTGKSFKSAKKRGNMLSEGQIYYQSSKLWLITTYIYFILNKLIQIKI